MRACVGVGVAFGGASAATVDGAVAVVVHLASVSLDRLKNNSAATKAEMAKLSSRLLKELGTEALEEGVGKQAWDRLAFV